MVFDKDGKVIYANNEKRPGEVSVSPARTPTASTGLTMLRSPVPRQFLPSSKLVHVDERPQVASW